jgi:hypothetical protein
MSNPLTCLVTDYGSTISADEIDHLIGQQPVDSAAAALRTLHDDLGLTIILASRYSATRVLLAWAVLARAFPHEFCLLGGLVVPRGSRELRS